MNYFLQNFNIEINKAEKENNQRIPIRIEASSETLDKDNDLILLSAYEEKTINDFLETGIIDYDHKSILGKDDEEKAKAVIGEPTNFKIEKSRSMELEVPVIYGDLYKENPFVRDSILPALKAATTRWGASIGGSILKSDSKNSGNKPYREISSIKLNHCAITPTRRAINKYTSVEMVKSSFEDFPTFLKALLAGAATDIINIQGGQALQPQSLEGVVKKTFPMFMGIMKAFKKAKLYRTHEGLDNSILMSIKDLPENEQIQTIDIVNTKKEEIFNLF